MSVNSTVASTRRGATVRRSPVRNSFIDPATVKSHVSSIMTKLGLRDRTQLVVFAYESGFVEAGTRDIGHCAPAIGHRLVIAVWASVAAHSARRNGG